MSFIYNNDTPGKPATVTTKGKVALGGVALLTAFAFGRYSKPETVKTETKIVEVEKKTESKEQDSKKSTHKKTITKEITKPNGEKDKTTIVVDDSNSDNRTEDKQKVETAKRESDKSEITSSSSKVTISALAGISIPDRSIAYGLSVTKPVLGPIAIGLWGLSDSTLGCSVGLSF